MKNDVAAYAIFLSFRTSVTYLLDLKLVTTVIGMGVFIVWAGGVIPNFRRNGVAHQLSNCQESWAENNGYSYIRMKKRKKTNP